MIPNALPPGLVDNPRLDQWISFEEDGRVRIRTGKVELGQGILTALVQIAADELDVAPARIDIASGRTQSTPNEGYTVGSMSVENSGGAIRLVAAEVRALLLAMAAKRLGVEAAELSIRDGAILRGGVSTGIDFWQLAPGLDFSRNATGTIAFKPARDRRVIGANLPRIDLPGKIFGDVPIFIHDFRPDGVVHARVIRQPWPGAELQTEPRDITLPNGARIVRNNNFLAVVATSEHAAKTAAERIARRLDWKGGISPDERVGVRGWIANVPSRDSTTKRGTMQTLPAGTRRLKRIYSKPFLAHASIGPSCALARLEQGRLQVWTHSQGVFPLRGALSRALGMEPAAIDIEHMQGAGCYGHNGADDAACDAAVIACALPGEFVRVQWSREDELAASPMGTAMVVALEAILSSDGRPIDWTTEIWSGPHGQRPGLSGVNLLAAEALPNPPPRPVPVELPETSGGSATRNAPLVYDVPHQTIINHIAAGHGYRTSSMRGLGAFANVFAIESFVDEIAEEVGADPIAIRLSMMSDARARAVIERARSMADAHAKPSGRGRGFAYCRYKNRAGYVALVMEVEVGEAVRVHRVWCATDAGLVINPDGVRNQIEGGIIQAMSWTLKEQVQFENGRVASRSWERYPILLFSEVPSIEIALIDRPDDPPLGVGEVAQGPTGAAIANAVADAIGIRIRDLPLTRDRIIAAINGQETG